MSDFFRTIPTILTFLLSYILKREEFDTNQYLVNLQMFETRDFMGLLRRILIYLNYPNGLIIPLAVSAYPNRPFCFKPTKDNDKIIESKLHEHSLLFFSQNELTFCPQHFK